MKNEAITALNINQGQGGLWIDTTLGGGGHSLEIVKKLGGSGKLIAVDCDSEAIDFARLRLKEYEDKIHYVKENYANITDILNKLGYGEDIKIDGALMDCGISSYQIDSVHRGFSYMKDAPLDMRLDKDQTLTAEVIVNKFEGNKIKEILYNYGEEKYAKLITEKIIKQREIKPIETTGELAEIIKGAVKNIRYDGGLPAKRTFQAIRICVNGELEKIEPALSALIERLKPGGKIVVINFHSLEDSIVKRCFKKYEKGCDCPPSFPVCICGKQPMIKILTKKPVYPSEKEIAENSRSESAKMRAAEKL
jgi:16S rRNA (cytosine1402-N4)-methyltransferase